MNAKTTYVQSIQIHGFPQHMCPEIFTRYGLNYPTKYPILTLTYTRISDRYSFWYTSGAWRTLMSDTGLPLFNCHLKSHACTVTGHTLPLYNWHKRPHARGLCCTQYCFILGERFDNLWSPHNKPTCTAAWKCGGRHAPNTDIFWRDVTYVIRIPSTVMYMGLMLAIPWAHIMHFCTI